MKLQSITYGLIFFCIVLTLLILGKTLLIPLVIAVVLWYLLYAFANKIKSAKVGSFSPPTWLAYGVALVGVGLVVSLGIWITTANINDIAQAAPRYQKNLEVQIEHLLTWIGLEEAPTFEQLGESVNLEKTLTAILNAASGIVSSLALVIIYFIFIFIEQRFFYQKLQYIFTGNRFQQVEGILDQINTSLVSYVSIKTFTSALTGVLSFVVLLFLDVDFASFWALLIFLLNYIPSVGSIIATIFPVLIAWVQFEQPTIALLTLALVGAIQVMVGNFIEPKLLGNRLNISSLVVLLSLAFWGYIWGVAGMFLCVPITVILIIIFNQFKGTRPFAILLSANGKLPTTNQVVTKQDTTD